MSDDRRDIPPQMIPTPTALTLSDVHKLVQHQFAVLPGIRPDDDPMADRHTARRAGNDLGAPRGPGKFLIIRQRNPIDKQHPHPGHIRNAGSPRISHLAWSEWNAVFEDALFLCFRPLLSERQEAFELFPMHRVVRYHVTRSPQYESCGVLLLDASVRITQSGHI